MSAWWLVAAFFLGMAFTWYIAGRLIYAALKSSVPLRRALTRMSYDALLSVQRDLQRELDKRVPPKVVSE